MILGERLRFVVASLVTSVGSSSSWVISAGAGFPLGEFEWQMQIGNGVGGGTYLCAEGTEWCLLLERSCWLLCVFAVLVSMIAGIGMFRLVCRWWMRGVVLRTLGSVGLPDYVMPVSTL